MTNEIHPLLGRVLGEVTLKLTRCNGVWHGELVEGGITIWTSRGEDTRAAVEKRAADFADYSRVEAVEM